jgi:GTPase SAR1 family protein
MIKPIHYHREYKSMRDNQISIYILTVTIVVILGDSAVGKTNIMTRYISNDYATTTPATIGVLLNTKVVNIDNNIIQIQIWDTVCNNMNLIYLLFY